MIDSKAKVDIALRSALVAEMVLQILRSNSKLHSKLVMQETVKLVMELDKAVKKLPED